MRHRKKNSKLNRTSSHRKALFANQLKSLVEHGKVKTTTVIGKELKRQADRLITIAKKEDKLSAVRQANAKMHVRRNKLSSKEARLAKQGDKSVYNGDRLVLGILFDNLAKRFANRAGGYTRLYRTGYRKGDHAETCIVEFLSE